jgi:hypothetical protein
MLNYSAVVVTYMVTCLNAQGMDNVILLEWPGGFQEVKVPRFLDNGTGWW